MPLLCGYPNSCGAQCWTAERAMQEGNASVLAVFFSAHLQANAPWRNGKLKMENVKWPCCLEASFVNFVGRSDGSEDTPAPWALGIRGRTAALKAILRA